MVLYKGSVEVLVDYPLMRIANSLIISKDLGFSKKIITLYKIKKVNFSVLIDISIGWVGA
jgi:hypothetical protein